MISEQVYYVLNMIFVIMYMISEFIMYWICFFYNVGGGYDFWTSLLCTEYVFFIMWGGGGYDFWTSLLCTEYVFFIMWGGGGGLWFLIQFIMYWIWFFYNVGGGMLSEPVYDVLHMIC